MRLIDADLLAKTIEKAQMESRKVNVLSLVHDAPTVHTEDCVGCPYCPDSNSGIPIGVE